MTPSWFEHADLMSVIIAFLILTMISFFGWFMKREFNNFANQLKIACKEINKKADKEDVEKECKELWERVNHHEHNNKGRVVIS